MIYLTADQHFSHSNIIKFCNRPFNDVHTMNKHITESWNKVVKPDDEIYVLGDVTFKLTKRGVRHIYSLLNGKKYIIKGNHDRSDYLNNLQNAKLIEWWKYNHNISYEHNGKTYDFSLSHYPHYPLKGADIICLFGHIHQNILDDNICGMMLNVGVDNIGYEPISIINIIEYYERNKLPLH